MRKIVLAFDSFKGSVTSLDITESLTRVIHEEWPTCEICSLPIADGGEGTLQAVERCTPLTRHTRRVHGPLMEWVEASYGITEDGTAVIEMAEASGLPLVPVDRRNPMETTTLGTGELIADALTRGCRKFIIGLGGSATNDAGIGVMQALGVRFLDEEGEELTPVGKNLERIVRIDQSKVRPELKDSEFTLACDVTNPFYGSLGAAAVFAPQKGATPEQVLSLDRGMQSFAKVLEQETGRFIVLTPGAGAAGGLGGGLMAFLNCIPKSGIDIILDLKHFDEILEGADVVLTGEGKIDNQIEMGKALYGVLKRAQLGQVPVIALGGAVEYVDRLNQLGFTAVFSIQPAPVSIAQAMQKEFTLNNLNDTALQVLRVLDASKQR